MRSPLRPCCRRCCSWSGGTPPPGEASLVEPVHPCLEGGARRLRPGADLVAALLLRSAESPDADEEGPAAVVMRETGSRPGRPTWTVARTPGVSGPRSSMAG